MYTYIYKKMGNYCSSGQKKKNKDNGSEKSEDSPSYELADINKSSNENNKGAPLADPEPTSDISNQNAPVNGKTIAKPESLVDVTRPASKHLQQIQQETIFGTDSASSSPLTLNAPYDIALVDAKHSTQLPESLQSLYGKPSTNRRTEKDSKIVLYILAADNDNHKIERSILYSVYKELKEKCASRGFQIHISDIHENNNSNEDKIENFFDVSNWMQEPIEAQGGHHLAAISLAEISRHTNISYIIPILFLGTTLGTPLLPLSIECQDFMTVLDSVNAGKEKDFLEKWYIFDGKAQPPCFRLKISDIVANDETNKETEKLLATLVDLFSKELRDSYLTTIVEQEINNTVLINQELSKRCVWIQTGTLLPKPLENATPLEIDLHRRLNNIYTDLKTQLAEKNVIRIPPTLTIQTEQLAGIFDTLITNSIDSIVDEHINKYQIPYCTYGLDRRLLEEIEAVNQHSKILGQNCANFDIVDSIQDYIVKSSETPLIIYGCTGSGKSVLTAKISQHIHTWLPKCTFIIRYTNLTNLSSDNLSILSSVTEQLYYIIHEKKCIGPHTMEFYTETLKNCFDKTTEKIIIYIDSIDKSKNIHKNMFDWIPSQLNENVKIILTVTSSATNINEFKNDDLLLNQLKCKFGNNFINLNQFSNKQWQDVLEFGGGDYYAANGALHLPEEWKSSDEKIPLKAKILWWLAWLGDCKINNLSLDNICNQVFEVLEKQFNSNIVNFIMSIILASRNGLMEMEIIELITEEKQFINESAIKTWTKFSWCMGPMLLHNYSIKLMDDKLKEIACQRYTKYIANAHKILENYYNKQSNEMQDNRKKFKCYNIQKLIELPYHAFKNNSKLFDVSLYFTDLSWINIKIAATGCVQFLNDIYLNYDSNCNCNSNSNNNNNNNNNNDNNKDNIKKHIRLLKKFLEIHFQQLNYDAQQIFNLFNNFLSQEIKIDNQLLNDEIIKNWFQCVNNISIPYLQIINNQLESCKNETNDEDDGTMNINGYDVITNLGGQGYFVASLSIQRGEICVWDVARCQKVRILKGIPQPTSLCSIGDYGAAVLCRREIKVIDLNEGIYKVTLKGVMNQKMPYYGIHDSTHLVCLSRNRMYVNLMNLESGDCVTTFKAGEDRFLNSLLVSGDGRILVCGDETQKPFPLLVWHLTQRKLLYDLRIPHHDFMTSLSAITHEGAYVCVVAKELSEPTPNFIVVYDLQSGTLFKKWKPSCNTVSLAISQTKTCVIAGLEDARILVWDLITGNCKYTFTGHIAPITLLKLDPLGKILLSADDEGRDLSIRLWDLDTGKLLAVHTPSVKITTCEILPDGKYVVLALENHSNLLTLELKNANCDDNVNNIQYGNSENEGKSFDLT